jgi:carbonic anhydrase
MEPRDTELARLFANNRAWAAAMTTGDPDFFSRLVRQQAPRWLWIGCSDSRVPANQIVGLAPGEVFVHRNVANLVQGGDLNCMTVLQFAIETLGVEHVIVCGHYDCGGVKAALTPEAGGLVDEWIQPIRELRRRHERTLAALSAAGQVELLCELNVVEQVRRLAETPEWRTAHARGRAPRAHGVVYGVGDGLLHDLGVDSDELEGSLERAAARCLAQQRERRS